jgi:uncharacterized membrane protein
MNTVADLLICAGLVAFAVSILILAIQLWQYVFAICIFLGIMAFIVKVIEQFWK